MQGRLTYAAFDAMPSGYPHRLPLTRIARQTCRPVRSWTHVTGRRGAASVPCDERVLTLANDEDRSNDAPLPELTRRGFLGVSLPVIAAAGLGTFTIGCGGAAIPSRTVVAGRAEDIPENAPQRLEQYDVYLIRNENGIAAVSGRCPHLGCGVRPSSSGFECPCHGSTFSPDGTVEQGPASTDLAWFEVRIEDGQVVVDPTHEVAKGTYTPLSPQVG